MLMPMGQAPTQFEEHKERKPRDAGAGGMQSTQPMPGVRPREAKIELREEPSGLIYARVQHRKDGHPDLEGRYVVSDTRIHCVDLKVIVQPRDIPEEELFLQHSFNRFA